MKYKLKIKNTCILNYFMHTYNYCISSNQLLLLSKHIYVSYTGEL